MIVPTMIDGLAHSRFQAIIGNGLPERAGVMNRR